MTKLITNCENENHFKHLVKNEDHPQ